MARDIEIEMSESDFNDSEAVSKVTGHNFEKQETISVVVEGSFSKGYRGSYWEPGEPAHIEDLCVWTYKVSQLCEDLNIVPEIVEITDYISPKQLDNLENQLLDSFEPPDPDYYREDY